MPLFWNYQAQTSFWSPRTR